VPEYTKPVLILPLMYIKRKPQHEKSENSFARSYKEPLISAINFRLSFFTTDAAFKLSLSHAR